MINTYSQLSEFFKKYKPEKKFPKLLNKKNELKTIIGFYIFGYNIMSGIKNFSTNRYFVDSININILPSEKKLILVKNELLKKFKIKNNDEKKLMSLLIKKINFQIKKFKSNKISKLYKKKIKPISKKQYNFFENNGYLVIENAININLLKKLLNTIEAIANKEKKNKTSFLYGSGRLQRVYHLIKKNKLFQEVIFHPNVMQICEMFFSRPTFHEKYFLSSLHANILHSGSEAQKLHIDSAVPDPIPKWPIRLNVNFILHDYTKTNGATMCVPGSHKYLKRPDASKEYKNKKTINAKKGSIVFWTGHLWHMSGENRSPHPRFALLGCFATSIMREMVMEENPYISLNQKLKNPYSANLKNLIGWKHGLKEY